MHPSEPARREHADAGERGEVRGRGHGRGTGRAASAQHREIADARLVHVVAAGDQLALAAREPDQRHAVDDRDRCRHGTARANLRLELARDGQALRPRKPVGDDRALERDDRTPRRQRVGHLGMHPQPLRRAHSRTLRHPRRHGALGVQAVSRAPVRPPKPCGDSSTGDACIARSRTSRQDRPSFTSAGAPMTIAVAISTACKMIP